MRENTPLNDSETAFFCSQMAMLLEAGITPADGVHILLQDMQEENGRALLVCMQEQLSQGNSLEETVKETRVFPPYVEHMIALGERSGNLDRVMASLSDYYERGEALRKDIKSAVAYPCVMILMMLFVIIVLITRVLPVFQEVFSRLGSELNAFSLSLLKAGNLLREYSLLFLALAALFTAAGIYFAVSRGGRRRFGRFLARFGPTRRIREGVAAGRFANGMALALSSGLDTYESLDLVASLEDMPEMDRKIERCRSLLLEGASFADAMARSEIFSNLYARMAAAGFRAGSADTAMATIAARYEEETDRRLQSLLSVLEPTLVILLSLLVGLILLSVILPLMGIMLNIG